jgi:glucan phosphoethanolaminetransferase (alkaline phosphatase superfamily)
MRPFYFHRFLLSPAMLMKNRFVLLTQRILLLFALYTFCRILFYCFNHSLYSDLTFSKVLKLFFFGLRFDAVAIVISNILFIGLHFYPLPQFYHRIYQGLLRTLFLVVNSMAVMLNFIDIEFVRFEGRRATTDAFRVMGFGNDFVDTAPRMILDYWYVLLLFIAVVYVLNKLYKRISLTSAKPPQGFLFGSVPGQMILAVITFGLCFIGFRGGIQYRPVNIMTASRYASGKEASLLLNTPFTILKTLGKNALQPMHYFSSEEAEKISPSVHHPLHPGEFRKLNVVIIIVESLGKEYMGCMNSYQGYTPFLDSLAKKSMLFTNAYANGKRSIEGIPCVIAGLPALMDEPFITSAYNGNRISSVAGLLKSKGYKTLFFHGGTNGTMGFDNFSRSAGYEYYYGRKEYNNDNDYDGNWGIYDEPFLQFTVKKLNEISQPFHAAIFTLSSHHPYKIPAALTGKFRKGTLPIHESISYADYALRKFFESASHSSWYDSTLFVITGDHTAISEVPFYQSHVGMYALPIIFFKPDGSLSGVNGVTTQQIDIIPGVLDYLRYDESFFAFGSSMFDSAEAHRAINYINGTYQLISGEYALTMDSASVLSYYHFTEDSLLTRNLKDQQSPDQQKMERMLKAMIQNYNDAMINNRMSAQ